METNETIEQAPQAPGLVLTFEAQFYLRQAGRWASFLSILGFIFCGLFLIFSFFAGSIFTRAAQFSPTPNPMASVLAGMGAGITVVYILIDVWYFFFALFLYQFADKIKQGIAFADNDQVTQSFSKLKSFFKLWGISTIVVLGIYFLVILIAVLIGFAAMHH